MDNKKTKDTDYKEVNIIFQNIIFEKDKPLARVYNPENIKLYWRIGKYIYEELQNSDIRAEYSSYLIKSLSKKLTFELGKGFSERRLRDIRRLYIMFPEIEMIDPSLGWTQLRILMRIKDSYKRNFYINLCKTKKVISTRSLESVIESCLYEQGVNQ